MRRSVLVATSAIALLGAMAAGPFGAAAAPPYVLGCTPAMINGTSMSVAGNYYVTMSIYNGSATTANLTHKILDKDGVILNHPAGGAYYDTPTTSTLLATNTRVALWLTGTLTSEIAASVRIVSNVPVSATLQHSANSPYSALVMVQCTPQTP